MLRWVSDRSLSRYFKEIMRYPLLSREEEMGYAKRARLGDVILEVEGKQVSSPLAVLKAARDGKPASEVALTIRRGEGVEKLTLHIPDPKPDLGSKQEPILGMKLSKVAELPQKYQEVVGTRRGVIVDEVQADSPAATADLRDYNREARDRLILHNLRWVVSIAKQYQNRGLALAELINEGNLGLIQAVSKFDETRNTRLTTYSNWWIRYYIVTALASRHLIKLPIKLRNLARRIRDSYGMLTQHYGRTPSIEEIARELKVTPDEVSNAFDVGVAELSIDALPFEDSKISFEEVLRDTSSLSPMEQSSKSQIEHDVRASISDVLADREIYVICRHFGIPLPARKFNLRAISTIFGLPRGEVKKLMCTASRTLLSHLRHSLGDDGLRRYARLSEADIADLLVLVRNTDEESERRLLTIVRKVVKNTPSSLSDLLSDLELAQAETFILHWNITPVRDELNLRELGDLLGISREAARQVKERAIKKLKKELRPESFDNFFRQAV